MDPLKENRGFCTSCGAALTGGAFCSSCGAKVAVKAAEEVTPVEEAAPVVEAAPVAPVVLATEPVAIPTPVAEPAPAAAPAAKADARKGPLVPLIAIGVAALYSFIMMCVPRGFLTDFMTVGALAAMIVGLIICNKEKNLFVAIGFLALAGIGFLGTSIGFVQNIAWRPGYAIFSFMFGTVAWAANAGIGVTYLLGKEKLANLKTLAAAAGAGIALLSLFSLSFVTRSFGWQLLEFLFYTLPLYAAVVLYTPFKK